MQVCTNRIGVNYINHVMILLHPSTIYGDGKNVFPLGIPTGPLNPDSQPHGMNTLNMEWKWMSLF